jgi:general stress protein 26
MDASSRQLILDILAGHNLLTVATLREDGWPQATTVTYVNDGLTLYFGTFSQAQKVANIRRCDKVSATIDHDEPDWNAIRALSLAGHAEILRDAAEIGKVQGLMVAKFPQLADMPEPDAGEMVFVKIVPVVFSVLDYTRGFGHTELVEV